MWNNIWKRVMAGICFVFLLGWLYDGIRWDFWCPVEWFGFGAVIAGLWLMLGIVYVGVQRIRIKGENGQDNRM